MKIGNLVAGAVRQVVKGVASTGKQELGKAGKSMLGQVVSGKHTSFQDDQAPPPPKTYNQLTAKGETKKFGLNIISQVSGKKFTYQELQELEAANGGTGNTGHDQLRSKINQMYQSHAQMQAKKQKEADSQKQSSGAEKRTAQQQELESGKRGANPMNPAVGKTRAEIGKSFGAE